MSKASDKELSELHGALAATLADAIREGEIVTTKDGEPIEVDGKLLKKPAAASLLSVARQFLKDNHIESGMGNKDMNALEQAMKDMESMPYPGEAPSDYQ